MVLISPLVVHPGKRVAEKLPLFFIRAFCTKVIARARDEFRGGVFGKIVEEPLPSYSAFKAMADYGMAVTGYGFKVFDWMWHIKMSN